MATSADESEKNISGHPFQFFAKQTYFVILVLILIFMEFINSSFSMCVMWIISLLRWILFLIIFTVGRICYQL